MADTPRQRPSTRKKRSGSGPEKLLETAKDAVMAGLALINAAKPLVKKMLKKTKQ